MAVSRHLIFLVLLTSLLPAVARAKEQHFDSHRDAMQDLLAAEKEATVANKKIWLDFGGNWCPPCVALDRTFDDNPELAAGLHSAFVVVHVNVGIFKSSKPTLAVRALYPDFKTVPHVLILAADGKLIEEVDRAKLMSNPKKDIYSGELLYQFFKKWGATEPPVKRTMEVAQDH